MSEFWLPRSGPMPKPESLEQARQVLAQEAFPAPKVSQVSLEASEFTSICPRSGQPDFGSVSITYIPKEKCLESKSIKFYLWAYRNEPAFCEELTARIAEDIVFAIEPQWLEVVLRQNPRGGIGIVVTAERGQR
ncbi:MAG: NADPH-dependent 7-cyano-7-deazaguanine reductase QueF [Thermaceae bacterium]|nr:NADPH-dependent 7-cyano-7-deazaguanine reductase QueF [Thermaceae bacterium]